MMQDHSGLIITCSFQANRGAAGVGRWKIEVQRGKEERVTYKRDLPDSDKLVLLAHWLLGDPDVSDPYEGHSAAYSTEFLYEWWKDPDNDADPGRWFAVPILKRTRSLVFVEYKLGRDSQTFKLRRRELEEKGETSWGRGYEIHHFYTEEKKNRIDEKRKNVQT